MKLKIFLTRPDSLERRYLSSEEKTEFLHVFRLNHFNYLIPFKSIDFVFDDMYVSTFLGLIEANSKITIIYERN